MKTSTMRYREKIVKGPVLRTLFSLSLPLIVVQLIEVSYNVADAFWLSLYSDVALSVPRQIWPLILFFSAFAKMLSSSNLALISQYIGAKRVEEASSIASKFLTASLILGTLFGAAFFLLRQAIFSSLIAVPGEIYGDVLSFAGIEAWVVTFSYLVLAYSTILQSLGDTLRPAVVDASFLVLNLVFDPLLIFGVGPFPRLGVVGAAVTDLAGNILSVAVLAALVRRTLPELRVGLTRSIDREWVALNLQIGLPVLFLLLSNSLAKMLQLRLVNAFGIVAATAYSFGFIAIDIANSALRGLAKGAAIMVGQSLGAHLPRRAREVSLKAALAAFTLTLLGSGLVYAFLDQFIGAFIQSPPIFQETRVLLQIVLFSLPFFAVLLIALFVGRGSGHTLPPTLIGLARLWAFWVGMGYLLAFTMGMGSRGLWIAMAAGNTVTGLAALAWLKWGKWTKPVIRRRGATGAGQPRHGGAKPPETPRGEGVGDGVAAHPPGGGSPLTPRPPHPPT